MVASHQKHRLEVGEREAEMLGQVVGQLTLRNLWLEERREDEEEKPDNLLRAL